MNFIFIYVIRTLPYYDKTNCLCTSKGTHVLLLSPTSSLLFIMSVAGFSEVKEADQRLQVVAEQVIMIISIMI